MFNFKFPVVELCRKQLMDVHSEDILFGGLFRLCDVYKGGGGYDRFPAIAKKRLGIETTKQFIVQLKGCPLDCTYCYVTSEGINGLANLLEAEDLINAFNATSKGVKVFHLMGGAPALYMEHWYEIIEKLSKDVVFHSDLLLIEKDYTDIDLTPLKKNNCLFAVSIKGNNKEEFIEKTRKELNKDLFWKNLDYIIKEQLPFYFTFTDINPKEISLEIEKRYGPEVIEDSFIINRVEYEAIKTNKNKVSKW